MEEKVLIIMGSESDREVMAGAEKVLDEAGVGYRRVVSSAHRDPDATREKVIQAGNDGIKVIIAGAGLSAALPGFCASFSPLPVIGVPIASGSLAGLDAHLALRILGLISD